MGVLRLILDRLKEPGRRPCGTRLGYVGGEPEVSQDSLDHRRVFNQRDQTQSPTAGWTRQHVEDAWLRCLYTGTQLEMADTAKGKPCPSDVGLCRPRGSILMVYIAASIAAPVPAVKARTGRANGRAKADRPARPAC